MKIIEVINLFEDTHLLRRKERHAETQLKQYYDKAKETGKEYFISYTKVDKIGVNPQSKWDTTPLGIYCYPLTNAVEEYGIDKNVTAVPFAGFGSHIWIFEAKSDRKMVHTDVYNRSDLDNDIKHLSRFLQEWKNSGVPEGTDLYRLIENFEERVKRAIHYSRSNNVDSLLRITAMISGAVENTTNKNKSIFWNFLLNDILDYHGIVDTGHGAIHNYEPTQAVFFRKQHISVVDKISNTQISKTRHSTIRDNVQRIKSLQNENVIDPNSYADILLDLRAHVSDNEISTKHYNRVKSKIKQTILNSDESTTLKSPIYNLWFLSEYRDDEAKQMLDKLSEVIKSDQNPYRFFYSLTHILDWLNMRPTAAGNVNKKRMIQQELNELVTYLKKRHQPSI